MRTISHCASSFANTRHSAASHDLEITRRRLLQLFGGAGLAAAILLKFGSRPAFAQDDGTPMPMATAQLGPRTDGSTVWHVIAGQMNMETKTEFHAFFPGEITINEGDAIWFDFGMGGFHTATFLNGADPLPVIIPDPEATATPAPGEAPKLILNPAVIFPSGGDTYDGTAMVNSGIDVFRDPSQPFVLNFTKAGSYDYICDVHAAVMKGKVIVQAAGSAAAHTQADYDAMAQDEMAQLQTKADEELKEYAEATSVANADGTTAWTATVGAGGESSVRIQAFLPEQLSVKVGDAVTWVHHASGEPHTVSFIGAGEAPPEDPVEQFADGSPKFVQNPLNIFPQGGDTWSGTGWVSSGLLGFPPAGFPETEYTLTFDTPGDYIYYCVLHGDSTGQGMAAKITVTAA
jgi:plastocyanin